MDARDLARLLAPHGVLPQAPLRQRPLTVVFPGVLVRTGREVFVKVLTSPIDGVRHNFRREIEILKALSGWRGTAALVASAAEDDFMFHACERVAGPSLDTLVGRKNANDLAVILLHTRGLARRIRDLHRLGIAHRDLSPDHVFVGPRGATTVVDFGMARRTLALSTAKRRLDEGYDVQAFGMILWEMICGRPLFP